MGKVIIDDILRNEEPWLAQKRRTIGSGDIPAIIGANRFCTPLKLWAIKTGRELPDTENDSMWLGKEMEPVIARIAARKLNLDIQYGNKLFGHDDIEWATATPDYFATQINDGGELKVLECKNVSWRMRRDWQDNAPLGPRAQVIWQCGVVGVKSGVVAPLIGGDMESFQGFEVEYDQRLFLQIAEIAERFMWRVKKDSPPAPTAADTKLVEDLIGSLEDKCVELPEDNIQRLNSWFFNKGLYDGAMIQAKESKEKMDEIRNQLRLEMGNAERAKCGPYEIKAKEVVKQPYTTKLSKYTLFTVKGGDYELRGEE